MKRKKKKFVLDKHTHTGFSGTLICYFDNRMAENFNGTQFTIALRE